MTKLVHGCVHAHPAKYSCFDVFCNVCSLCLGVDDTNRRMKTNDMSETMDRDVVILLIYLTGQDTVLISCQ